MTHSMRCVLLALGALTFSAPANAQDPRLVPLLDDSTRARVESVVDSARRAQLPTEPLVDKALEGARKRAPGPRILAAVTALADRLRVARAALGTHNEAELVAGAAALQAGVGPHALADLRESRPGRPLAIPLVVLSDLVTRGVPRDTATALVLLVARAGLSDDAFLEVQRSVQNDVRDGANPVTAAAVRARGALVGTPARVKVRGPVTTSGATVTGATKPTPARADPIPRPPASP
jgi:hypothetical protein